MSRETRQNSVLKTISGELTGHYYVKVAGVRPQTKPLLGEQLCVKSEPL